MTVTNQVKSNERVVCFYGDSLVESTPGFYQLICDDLEMHSPEIKFRIHNFAKGGSTVIDVKNQIMQGSQAVPNIDVSLIGVGINDIWRKYQGRASEAVGINEFERYYRENIEILKSRSAYTVCLGEPLVQLDEIGEAFNKELSQYNLIIQKICAEDKSGKLLFIDLFSAFEEKHIFMINNYSNESLWTDGVHLSEVGNLLAAETILNEISELEIFT